MSIHRNIFSFYSENIRSNKMEEKLLKKILTLGKLY